MNKIILTGFIVILIGSNLVSFSMGKKQISVQQTQETLVASASPSPLNTPLIIASNQVLADKVYFKDNQARIDGSIQDSGNDPYYLKVNDEEYISSSQIKSLYKLDNQSGLVVKGYPIEGEYLLKADGIIHLDSYYKKLNALFTKQAENKDYTDISLEVMDGLKLTWGEVGLRKLEILKPNYQTQRGIMIGSTRDDVQRAYGLLGKDDSTVWYTFRHNAEYSEGSAYAFYFQNSVVSKIDYGWVN